MEMNSEHWETPATLPDMEKELKRIRRDLRRRSWKIVLTSLLCAAAIVFASVQYAIPALEKQYWDPNTSSYIEGITDLELTMNVYNELFGHGKHFMSVDIYKKGFANYSLETSFVEYQTKTALTDITFHTASLTKSELTYPTNFWNDVIPGVFYRNIQEWLNWRPKELSSMNQPVRRTLEKLPNYVDIFASITFSKDLTMDELLQLQKQYGEDTRFVWAILRCQDANDDYIPQCGVHLTDYQSSNYKPDFWTDTKYPKLFCDRYNWSSSDIEQHISSMLRFSDDQIQMKTGILPECYSNNYYKTVLNYFETNGIQTYGCYVISSAKDLLSMTNSGVVALVRPLDTCISFS